MFGNRSARGRAGRAGRLLALLTVLLLAMTMLAACGEEDDLDGGTGSNGSGDTPATPTQQPASPTPSVPPIAHPTGEDEIVLQISYEGGFVPAWSLLQRHPLFTLTGDGRIITEGPMIEIYPQPALPNLLVTEVTEEGIQRILRAAQEAGLLAGDAEYPYDMIADAATTVFRVTADGKTTTVKAYALAEGAIDDPNLTEEQRAAREQLSAFLAEVTDLTGFLPAEEIVSSEQPYEIDRLQVVFLPSDAPTAPQESPDLEHQEKVWPLETPIAELGEPFTATGEEMRCAVIEGEDLATLLPELEDANQLTMWESGDAQYYLYLRVLLGDETGCSDLLGQ